METPALVLVDLQKAIDDPLWGPRNNPGAEQVVARLLTSWRDKGAPIWHVLHDSTEAASPYRPDGPGHPFKPEALPADGEPVIAKRTNSAFIGTDFEARLRAAGHNRLVFCGVITNNSLEATVRNAGNLGFEAYVVGEGCWTVDKRDLTGRVWSAAQVHALSLANLHGEYATVIDANEAVTLLR